ncbi:MAG: alpha/beta fold hydrolase [Hymenobacteraceae bacterium]|nr:alpha/beta fold hydrolase [Hymenobacteraceae bacterium]MDX5397813.1 alpha/beta fold hydrolase [Hymenobacteraceae bacterium]MDX5513892.1 alpha/beta fold hydrolase [Hymenobacteraceae bacterium]
MKKQLFTLFASALLALPALSQNKTAAEANAKAFVNHLTTQQFTAAAAMFDEKVSEKVNDQALAQLWVSLQMQMGPFQKTTNLQVQEQARQHLVQQTCWFEKQNLDLKLVLDEQGKIAGIFFVPATQQKVAYELPEYADPAGFTEQELLIKSGNYELPATLTLPARKGKVPVVVLVHGSGPHDRDDSVGPNKPFKDLALGLAAQGIATLRYEKRTKKYASEVMEQYNTLTVQQEVLDDAVAAVRMLKSSKALPVADVYVLGHSLGGMLAPRLAAQLPEVKGVVLMAANARPLEDLVLEQMQYLLALQNNASEAQLLPIKQQVNTVKSSALTAETPSGQLPLGLPATYWLDLRPYKQTEVARKLKQRVLVLQGKRDYQVTTTDFKLWQEALKPKKNVEFKSYSKLNHLFLEGEGPGTPEEYNTPGHIPAYVIDYLAAWLKQK